MPDQPDCDWPDGRPADYYDPDTNQTLCRHHALEAGVLTAPNVWVWNGPHQRWDH